MSNAELRPANRDVPLAGYALLSMIVAYVAIPLAAYSIIPAASKWCGAVCGETLQAAAAVAGVLGGIVTLLLAARHLCNSWRGAFALLKINRFRWRSVGRALYLTPLLLLAGGLLTALWWWAGRKIGLEFALPPSTQALSTGTPAARLILAGSAMLLAPLLEEMLFRRAIFGAFSHWMAPALAAVLTALCFSSIHFSLLQLPGLWWLGWNWQRVVRKDDSLWSSILLHAGNNVISVGALLLCSGIVPDGKFGW